MYIFLKKCSDNATNTCLKIDIYFGCTCFLIVFVAGSMNELGSLLKSKRLQMCFTHYLFFNPLSQRQNHHFPPQSRQNVSFACPWYSVQ